MTDTIRLVSLLVVLSARLFAPGQEHRHSLSDLAWIAGCWNGGDDKLAFDEQWMRPSGGMMLGMGRTIAHGKVVDHEFIRLHEQENGDIFYTAHPSGQSEASFKLTTCEKNLAVFENPEHDFPQRIIYRLNADGSLAARIEGKKDGKEGGVDFPMKRVKCE